VDPNLLLVAAIVALFVIAVGPGKGWRRRSKR
jgi:hypothetical protein